MFQHLRLSDWAKSQEAWYLKRIDTGKSRYLAVEKICDVPWQVVACIHALECSFNFKKHLHNGDPIWARTVRVPAGRPYHNDWTWETSAADALKYDKLDRVDWTNLESALLALEKYNGMGYARMDKASPYLWGGTQFFERGKYVADGVYDPDATTKQLGVAPLLKATGWTS